MTDKECNCCEDVSTEDLAVNNNILINTLIELLIQKKVFSEEEFQEALDADEE
jgi:hypothetical protein